MPAGTRGTEPGLGLCGRLGQQFGRSPCGAAGRVTPPRGGTRIRPKRSPCKRRISGRGPPERELEAGGAAARRPYDSSSSGRLGYDSSGSTERSIWPLGPQGPCPGSTGTLGIWRGNRAGRGASCDRRDSSPSTGRHPATGAEVRQGRDQFGTVGSKCRPPRPSRLRPTADPQRKPPPPCAWSLSSKECAMRRPEHRGSSSEYGEPPAACPTRLTPPPLSGELWLCMGWFGALLAVLLTGFAGVVGCGGMRVVRGLRVSCRGEGNV